MKIDVAISYYGKPYQTIVTLLSLWQHCNQWIGRVYLSVEKKQPYLDSWKGVYLVAATLPAGVVELQFMEESFPWMTDEDPIQLSTRQAESLRYQKALLQTDKPWLVIMHNDILVKEDVLGAMIAASNEEIAGLGHIGQCWNCPAFIEKVCDSERFTGYQPTMKESLKLIEKHKPPRGERHKKILALGHNYPLPECRLNEHLCLINVKKYREFTLPNGTAPYFGGVWDGTDTAAAWFRGMVNQGQSFKNFFYDSFAIHAPFSSVNNGNDADSHRYLYDEIEAQSKAFLRDNYPNFKPNAVSKLKGDSLYLRKKIQRSIGGFTAIFNQ